MKIVSHLRFFKLNKTLPRVLILVIFLTVVTAMPAATTISSLSDDKLETRKEETTPQVSKDESSPLSKDTQLYDENFNLYQVEDRITGNPVEVKASEVPKSIEDIGEELLKTAQAQNYAYDSSSGLPYVPLIASSYYPFTGFRRQSSIVSGSRSNNSKPKRVYAKTPWKPWIRG